MFYDIIPIQAKGGLINVSVSDADSRAAFFSDQFFWGAHTPRRRQPSPAGYSGGVREDYTPRQTRAANAPVYPAAPATPALHQLHLSLIATMQHSGSPCLSAWWIRCSL